MTTTLLQRLVTVSLALLSLALLVCGIINYQQQGRVQLPDDGVTWVDSDQGVRAWIVAPTGPGYRAGVHEGDILKTIDSQPIGQAADAVKAIFEAGLWSKATYELARQGQPFETTVVITAQTDLKSIRGYLELVGLLYLLLEVLSSSGAGVRLVLSTFTSSAWRALSFTRSTTPAS